MNGVLEWDSIFGCRVRHAFLKQEQKPDGLVVLFPGRGYTCEKPLLYYAAQVAWEQGYDVLCLEYGFYKAGKPFLAEDVALFCEELCATLREAEAHSYECLYCISKSLGTVLAGAVCTLLGHPNVQHLFLTPVERTLPYMLNTKSLAVIGTADDSFPQACLEQTKADGTCGLVFIEDADHSLETPHGSIHNLSVMQRIAGIYESFLK